MLRAGPSDPSPMCTYIWAHKHRFGSKQELRTNIMNKTNKRISKNVFSSYITFYATSSTIYPLFFHLPQRFLLNTLPIPYYNHTISFHIPTFYILSIFYLLTITRRPTSTRMNNAGGSEQWNTKYAERRGPTHKGPAGGSVAGVRHPLQMPCQGRGLAISHQCSQPKNIILQRWAALYPSHVLLPPHSSWLVTRTISSWITVCVDFTWDYVWLLVCGSHSLYEWMQNKSFWWY
jgi:hypothetical protein